jgi:hypothetical protein
LLILFARRHSYSYLAVRWTNRFCCTKLGADSSPSPWNSLWALGGSRVRRPGASFASFTFFTGMVLSGRQHPSQREIHGYRKKKKNMKNTHKPHVSCGFRRKLSSYLGMKEAERR